ncbi:MAG: S8 family serine peptidase [Nitrospirota bacterium]
MPSQTCSRTPSSRFTKRSRWLRIGAFALACSAGSLLLWNDISTADGIQENRGFNRVTGSSVEPAQYIPGEVIVKYLDSASRATVAAAGGQMIKSFAGGEERVQHVKLNKGETVEDALERYRHSPAIEYAEPNYIHQLAAIPNDTRFTSLWGLHNTGQTVNGTGGTADIDIDAPEAWDITTGSANVIIAVIDSGIAYDHPDLAANMWRNPGEIPNDGIDNDGNGLVDDVFGYDFRSNDSEPMDPIDLTVGATGGNPGHGTHVAGTIGAVGNNSSGVTGVMHTVQLMALKAGGVDNGLPSNAIVEAINYAVRKGARAINASFTRQGDCSRVEYDALSAANAAGVMVLAAAGNAGSNNDVNSVFPAGYSVTTSCGAALPNVISVAAITQTGGRAGFSNFGATSVQIAAPGVNTNSTKPTSNTANLLLHNFDSNPTGLGYTFSGINNSWGFTNTRSSSPSTSMTDSPAGNYLDNTVSEATSPIFSTAGQRGCRLESRLRLATQNDADGIQTDVSGDGGANWFTQSGFTGSTNDTFVRFTMAELPDRKPNVQYRFEFVSNSSIVDDGVYLDDVRAYCVSGTPSATNDYQFLAGTSMATPHVTGVVGLLLSINPNLTVAQIRNAILNTGEASPLLNGVVSSGRRLNAFNALNSIAPTFTVMVAKNGTGTGTVASIPAGINCGGDCNERFPGGATVILTATPSAGSLFTGWTGGGCSGTGSCAVTTTGTVTATFNLPAPAPFTVAVNKNGTGAGAVTSAPAGITCGADCTGTYPGGTRVTLTAAADAGSVFTGWNGGVCAGAGLCVVSNTATVTATFSVIPPPITVTVDKNGTGTGTVTSTPAGIDCGGDCTGTYPGGTTVTLTPRATAGSRFAGWSGGCSGTTTCQVASTVSVTATFNVLPPPGSFTVTILKGGTGTGKVVSAPTGIDCGAICNANFFNNTNVTLTATADGGATFTGWSGGGCTGTGSCVVSTAASVTANFDGPPDNAVAPSSAGGGGCTIAHAGTNDALMPIMLLMTIGALVWRSRRRL